MAADADRNLLFGLLALQNGLIDQDQLVGAFRVERRNPASRAPQTPTRLEPQFPGHLPLFRPMPPE
jgi:hypothetical protein